MSRQTAMASAEPEKVEVAPPDAARREGRLSLACAPTTIEPAQFAATSSALIGRRVRFASRIERMVDFTDAIVVAGRDRFVVTAAPDTVWAGVQVHSFTVLGFASVGIHGATVLPHLLLDDSACER